MNKKHLALIVVVVLVVAGAASAAVWKYNQTSHVSYKQLQSQNKALAKELTVKDNALVEASTQKQALQATNTKLTADKAQLCVQVKLSRLPSTVCNQ